MYVIGDIHGDGQELNRVLSEIPNDSPLVFLGDLVDRGPDSIGVVNTVADLVDSGRAELIVGNHDDKFYRYLYGNPVKVRGGLEVTIEQLCSIGTEARIAFEKRFIDLMDGAYLFISTPSYTLAHASYHPMMSNLGSVTYGEGRKAYRSLAQKAFYGESFEDGSNGKPIRSYGWFKSVPEGHSVFIGHDVISTVDIVCRVTQNGGYVNFVDTGCQKNGKLSYAKVPDA